MVICNESLNAKTEMKNGGDKKIFYHKEQSYSCLNCGKCCRLWDVPITTAEKDRISKLKIDGLPIPIEECFVRDTKRKNVFLIRKKDGNCIFFDEKNYCRIHSAYGEKVKPLACRIYPFDTFNWKDHSVSASFRFDCHAVVARKGKKIGDYQTQILGFSDELARSGIFSDAIYRKGLAPGLDKLRTIAEGYKSILLNDEFRPAIRILAAARLLEFHGRKENRHDISDADKSFGRDASGLAQRSVPELEDDIENGPELDLRRKILFRYMLSGFIRTDEAVRYGTFLIGRLRRLKSLLKFSLGSGRISDFIENCDEHLVADPFRTLEKFHSKNEIWQIYWSYVGSKLSSLHFCGYPAFSYTFEEGMRHLIMTFPVAAAVASLYHEIDGNKDQKIDANDFQKALMAVDHTFSRSPFFRLKHVKKISKEFCRGDVLPSLLKTIKISESHNS